MNHWPHKVNQYTREAIKDAIRCPEWQVFRESLKRLPTTEKLDCLDYYLHRRGIDKFVETKTQVDNYINALLRGGQLKWKNNQTLIVNR